MVLYLRRIGKRIPDHRPSQEQMFRLAHMKDLLEVYSATANDELPNHLARCLHTLTLHFDRAVRQFPKWREFVRNAQQDRLTVEQAAEVPVLANAIILALREDDVRSIIDSSAPFGTRNSSSTVGRRNRAPASACSYRKRQSVFCLSIVEFVANIMKRIAEAALATKNFGSQYGRKWKEGFAKEALTSSEKDGGKTFIW